MAGEPSIVRLYQPDREREKRALLLLLDGVAISMTPQPEGPQETPDAVRWSSLGDGESPG
jgi:hypothetical protein